MTTVPGLADFRRAAREHLKGRFAEMLASLGALAGVWLLISAVQDFTRALMGVSSLSLFVPVESADFWRQYVPNMCITLGSALFSLLLLQPLLLGVRRLFWRAVNNRPSGLSGLFDDFSSRRRYARALLFSLLLYLRYITFSLLMLPGLALYSLGSSGLTIPNIFGGSLSSDEFRTFGTALGGLLTLLGFVLFVRLMLRYFLARILFVDDDTLAPEKALRLSARAMKGYKGRLVSLVCSYAGWLLLCFFILPLLYVAPYIHMGYTSYARFVIEDNIRAGHLFPRQIPAYTPEESSSSSSPGKWERVDIM